MWDTSYIFHISIWQPPILLSLTVRVKSPITRSRQYEYLQRKNIVAHKSVMGTVGMEVKDVIIGIQGNAEDGYNLERARSQCLVMSLPNQRVLCTSWYRLREPVYIVNNFMTGWCSGTLSELVFPLETEKIGCQFYLQQKIAGLKIKKLNQISQGTRIRDNGGMFG